MVLLIEDDSDNGPLNNSQIRLPIARTSFDLKN